MEWSEWQGVIGALGGVVLTGLIGFVTAKMTHAWQREQREETRRQARADLRRDAYLAYLARAQKLGDQTAAWLPTNGQADPSLLLDLYARDMADPTHELDACERRVRLVAGKQVQAAMATYRDWFREAIGETVLRSGPGLTGWDDKEAPLIEAMHRELDEDLAIRERK